MVEPNKPELHRRWTDPERWQVGLAIVGLLVAVIAAVGQFVQ